MKVAVVGAGISGVAAAHELARSGGASVTVYDDGGQAKSVALDEVGNIDLGFLVFNRVSYPNTVEWLEGLGMDMERSDTSLSVSTQLSSSGRLCEWGSRKGGLSPTLWCMIHEIRRFNHDALRYLEDHQDGEDTTSFGKFIQKHGYSHVFQEAYLIPMCACIWSCPSQQQVLGFSAFAVLSFYRDHHLLQLFGRPQWLTIRKDPSSHSYVDKVRKELERMGCRIKTSCQVKSVSSFQGGHRVLEVDGSEEMYDKIIFTADAPHVLKLLGDEATVDELRILGTFHYNYSDIYLHCDKSLMPRNTSAWSALNFLGTTGGGASVTYWLNLLQNIESSEGGGDNNSRLFLVTLNPPHVPNHVLLKWNVGHPVPSVDAAGASLELHRIQGNRGIWFCEAYQGYGFHEVGLKAGKAAAQGLLGETSVCPVVNPKQMIPSWTEAGARLLVTRFLNQYISVGNLTLLEEGGSMFSFGEAGTACDVKSVMRVHDPLFYWKLATEADIGLADSYVNGYISFVDKRHGLMNLFQIFIANRDAQKSCTSVGSTRGWWTPLLVTAGVASAKYFLRHVSRKNSVTQTRRNISQHYDLSNDFFSLFMDPTMSYSCPIFKAEEESLEVAQLRKIMLLIDKARVERCHHLLEIGSGWGSLAVQVVKQTGCKYTGITLSEEQLKYSQSKVKEAGLEDRVTFLLCDYRQIPTCEKYDRIIACEMIEAVGHEYMDDFFACCETLLAQDGLFVLQFTAIPEDRYDEYRRSSDFIKEYIFPGGSLPCLARVTSAMSTSSRLCIQHVENIGYSYYPTLIRWRENFIANKDAILALGFDDKFIRVWDYYFIYSAAGFISWTLANYQIVLSRAGNKLVFAGNPYASFPAA